MHIQKLLVPFDLKEESYVALLHAAEIAKISNAQIYIVHLVKRIDDADAAQNSMNVYLSRFKRDFQGKVEAIIRVGSIFSEIESIAQEVGTELIILPTHGISGKQRFIGSNALRMATETKIPYLIIQERPPRASGYKKIVVPISFRPQILDESDIFIKISKLFDAEVYLHCSSNAHGDFSDQLLESLVQRFEKEGAPVQVIKSNDKSTYAKSCLRFASSIDADLICSINYSYEYLYTLFPRGEEEDFIYNDAQIPVLMVAPEMRENLAYFPVIWH